MTGVAAEVERELRALAKEGKRIAGSVDDGRGMAEHLAYQHFYTKALAALRVLAPDRYDEFVSLYEDPKRKDLTGFTWGLRDFYKGITPPGSAKPELAAALWVFMQTHIILAVAERAPTVLADVRSALQAEVLDEDLDVARQLLKSKHVRASGAVAGVVLERHLASVATAHGVGSKKRSPTIADLNDPLRDGGVYDTVQWRFVQRLADIRNLAVHSKDREPSADEVRELIDGADKIVKTVY
jgi:hypothetical protein